MAAAGPPLWAGSDLIVRQVEPIALRYGAPTTSRKRPKWHPLSISNPGSDHNEANTTASARDNATFNGAPLAYAIARHFVLVGFRTGNYNGYAYGEGGAVFRLQVLWAVSGHFDHTHTGARLSAGSYKLGPTPLEITKRAVRPLGRRQRRAVLTLLYRRRRRKAEARTGRGPRWRKWDRLVDRSARKVKRLHRRAGGKRKAILGRAVNDRDGYLK